jgi:cysteinyl-tRNA synthetase
MDLQFSEFVIFLVKNLRLKLSIREFRENLDYERRSLDDVEKNFREMEKSLRQVNIRIDQVKVRFEFSIYNGIYVLLV